MLQMAENLLKKYYGYSSFRHGQRDILQSLLSQRDTIGIMPTGGGKSICYQIPALLADGITVIISPLISLMKDQVDSLTDMGIPAAQINSSMGAEEIRQQLEHLRTGNVKLLYISPERLESDSFQAFLRQIPVSFVAVDEAHCVSQWGHDFRPSYQAIARWIATLPARPLVGAFTATATPEVVEDIRHQLSLRDAALFVTGFRRDNLALFVYKGEDKRKFIQQYLRSNPAQAGIIYTATRKEADSLYQFLLERDYRATRYHAGLSETERRANQDLFLFDEANVMVATNAFGMGIDKSNVRFVIHYNMPKNMESYYQEAGRAGRDGDPSECILLFSPQDVQIQKYLIEQSPLTPDRQSQEYKKLNFMVDYCQTQRCLQNVIVQYFGDEPTEECGICGNCKEEAELADITVEAQKIISCVKRMNERYGIALVAQVLKGSKNKKVLQFAFDKLPTYGLLKELPEAEIQQLIQLLAAEGYLGLTNSQFPVLQLREKALPVVRGEERVYRKIRISPTQLAANDGLFDRLAELRKYLAKRDHIPPYIVFTDKTLKEMSRKLPADKASMLAVSGVGEIKFERYGNDFLELIQTYLAEKETDPPQQEQSEVPKLPESPELPVTRGENQKTPSHQVTYTLYQEGNSIDEIARIRQFSSVTIETHLMRAWEEGCELDWSPWVPAEYESLILETAAGQTHEKLSILKEQLPPEISYFALKATLCKHGLWRKR